GSHTIPNRTERPEGSRIPPHIPGSRIGVAGNGPPKDCLLQTSKGKTSMRAIHRFALLRIILSGLLLSVASRALAEDLAGSCTENLATNTTTCRIDNPIVTQRMTEYDG